ALDPELQLGQVVTAGEVIAGDGASRALGTDERLSPDARLTEALKRAGGGPALVVASTDLFYDPRPEALDGLRAAGASVVEMEAAAVLAVAARRGVEAACVLLVSDVLAGGERQRLAQDEPEAGGVRLGEIALRALARA